jgi:hypothetical protein
MSVSFCSVCGSGGAGGKGLLGDPSAERAVGKVGEVLAQQDVEAVTGGGGVTCRADYESPVGRGVQRGGRQEHGGGVIRRSAVEDLRRSVDFVLAEALQEVLVGVAHVDQRPVTY